MLLLPRSQKTNQLIVPAAIKILRTETAGRYEQWSIAPPREILSAID
jgi:hypothetical protein